mmetsp:Transcript_30269/g.67829  ORF Transcript_30269/g.67829 Transcript_30269/m.67829 type:complete len:141 (+) Transcript_30269:3-425(+)
MADLADQELVAYFTQKIGGDEKLARALAALSGLSEVAARRSLLTSDASMRTVRVVRHGQELDQEPGQDPATRLSPSEVTKLFKGLGFGKMPRIEVQRDGSCVFDLPTEKAERFVSVVGTEVSEGRLASSWKVDLPDVLPN